MRRLLLHACAALIFAGANARAGDVAYYDAQEEKLHLPNVSVEGQWLEAILKRVSGTTAINFVLESFSWRDRPVTLPQDIARFDNGRLSIDSVKTGNSFYRVELNLIENTAEGVVFGNPDVVPLSDVPGRGQDSWVLSYHEDFEDVAFPDAPWLGSDLAETGRYTDEGAYFLERDFEFRAPAAYRAEVDFGAENWLRLASYSRSDALPLSSFFAVGSDPAGGENQVLGIRSREHSDGTVLRSRLALPDEYIVCTRVGSADFGDGLQGNNGYDGDEQATPWVQGSAINENGYYWLAILDEEPRPRNNIWIHHHRKLVIDSDNNNYGGSSWSYIWNGADFIQSGEQPIMAFALDANGAGYKSQAVFERSGLPFISLANDDWHQQKSIETADTIRGLDAYLDETWYEVCVQKTATSYGLYLDGDFQYGGSQSYWGTLDLSSVYHALSHPDYFMMGDPHINYYEGQVYFDDVKLYERPR